MPASPAYCQHPDNLEGCRQALVKAWKALALAEHCVTEGLRQGFGPCGDVLVGGLSRGRAAGKKGSGEGQDRPDPDDAFQAACQTAVLLGYQQELAGAKAAFLEAYYQLVRCAIGKFGFRDSGTPSADDVYQEVFLGLHQRLRKGATVEPGRLGIYVWQTAMHACFRALRSKRPQLEVSEAPMQGGRMRVWPRPDHQRVLETEVAEAWEDLDWRLSRTEQGDLINRIILAHKGLAAEEDKGKLRVKELMAGWRHLAKCPETEVKALHDRIASEASRWPQTGLVWLAAGLLNAGAAQAWQIPVIFCAGTGKDIEETRGVIEQLSKISEEAVYTRISRTYAAFRPEGGEEPGRPMVDE
jgi:DNA-directed RNA polymerase specialized sigma24 family protein